MDIRCLIIDRDPIFQEQLGMFIQAFRDDFKVQHVSNIDLAIEAIASTDISLVLCEPSYAEPETGLVSSCLLKKKPAVPLIITGHDDTCALSKMIPSSCLKGFIARPMASPTELAGKVVLALGSLFNQGFLRSVSCITLIQILEQECGECTLRVINTREKNEGLLFIKKGTLLDALCGNTVDLEALKTVLSWKSVDIELYNICPLEEKRINGDLTSLILQCTEKQQLAECTPAESKIKNVSPKIHKPVGGLAGLFLNVNKAAKTRR